MQPMVDPVPGGAPDREARFAQLAVRAGGVSEKVARQALEETRLAGGRLVDRLLTSPHFGERWGRHWLDAVGYTDTVGFDIDANLIVMPKGKWRYRDYVIRSLNADKPYDRFVREQLAGDEMVDWRNARRFDDRIRDHLIATGMLRTAADFTHEPESFIASNMYSVLFDTMEIVNTSLRPTAAARLLPDDGLFHTRTEPEAMESRLSLETGNSGPRDRQRVGGPTQGVSAAQQAVG